MPPEIETLKKEGNKCFKQGNYSKALEIYSEANAKVKESKSTDETLKVLAVLHSNVAACFHKLGFYKKCIEECNEAIKLFPFWEKLYKRRHEAFKAFKNYLFTSDGDCEETIKTDRGAAHIIVDCKATKKKQKKKNGQLVYKSLNEAFLASKNSDKIFIEKGLHTCQSHVIFGKNLQIFGASTSECVIEGTKHNTIVFHGLDQQPAGLLKRVTLRLSPKNGYVNTLSVLCGYLDIVDCIIQDGSSTAYSSLGVSRRDPDVPEAEEEGGMNPLDLDTRLTVKYCILDGVKGGNGGVLARGGGHLVIENCFISGFSANGIWTRDEGTKATISNCDIQHNHGCGVTIHKKASVVIQGNYVHGNGSGETGRGMELGPDIKASVYRNFITNNTPGGVGIDHSTVRVESNIISNHPSPEGGIGVYVIRKGDVIVKSNVILNNAIGLFTQDGACPLITNNQLDRCDNGCFSRTQSTPKILNNVFTKCRYGVTYHFESSGVLAENTFKDSPLFAVMVAKSCRPELNDNTYINCGFGMPPREPLNEFFKEIRKEDPDILETWDIRNREEERKCRDAIRAQPKPQGKLRVCCYCCNHSNHTKLCSKCRSVYYCSKECQKNHWKVHKKYCVTRLGPARDLDETENPPSEEDIAEAWKNMLKM